MTERATTVFNSTNPLVHAALTRLAPIVLAAIRVQDKAAPRLGQLAASYRGCPIAKGGGRIGSLRAGDRVPDSRASDRDARLYDLLDLSTLTLFVTGDRVTEACRPWRDVVAFAACRSTLGPRAGCWSAPTATSRRPADPTTGAALSRWLDRWLIRTSALSAARAAGSRRPRSSSINAHSAVAAIHSRAASRGCARTERLEVGGDHVDVHPVAARDLLGDRQMPTRLQQQRLHAAVAQTAVEVRGGGRRQPVPARRHFADDRHHLVEQHIVEAPVQRHQIGHPVREMVEERPFRYAGARDDGVDARPSSPSSSASTRPVSIRFARVCLRGRHPLVALPPCGLPCQTSTPPSVIDRPTGQ